MKIVKMKTHISSFLCFLISVLLLIISCRKIEETQETAVEPTKTVETMPDTTDVEHATQVMSSLEKLEIGKTEVETRLEALLSLIEQKERSLLERETRLLEQQASLEVQAENLTRREKSVKRQQILSWLALTLGLGGIIFVIIATVIGRKKQKKPQGKTEIKTRQESKVKSEPTAAGKESKRKEEKDAKAESKVAGQKAAKKTSQPKARGKR